MCIRDSTYTDPNSAYPAGRGTYLSGYDSIHIVPITGADLGFIRVWDARHPSEDNVDNNYPDDKNVFIDLTPSVKSKINMIKAIQKEPTNVLTYIYPVEVSDMTATVLPLQANNNDYISVSIAQPLSAGLGRSIQIDLKSNKNKSQYDESNSERNN